METILLTTVLLSLTAWLVARTRGRPAQVRPYGHAAKRTEISVLPPLETSGDRELEAFLARQYRKRRYYFRATLSSGQQIGVGHTPGENWVDVVARRQQGGEKSGAYAGPYEDFAYHIRQGRWSFGAHPPHAHEISRILASYLGAKEQQPRY